MEDIRSLEQQYPQIQIEEIGHSVIGQPIVALRMGTGARYIHINASCHGNEWITTPLLMKFVDDCLRHAEAGTSLRGYPVRQLLQEVTLIVVPMVNPDGVDLSLFGASALPEPYGSEAVRINDGSGDFSTWKANGRGVDLNDQFPAGWERERERSGVIARASRNYGGEVPLSEPEAQALVALTKKYDFEAVYAIHTQGEEIYWNYRDFEPAESEVIVQRLQAVSGCLAVKLTDSDAGFKDWFIQEYRRPGFTIELGKGVNPVPIGQFTVMYERLAPLLLEGLTIR